MNEKLKKEIVEWGKALIFAAIVAILLLIFARPSFVIGKSMNSTFSDGDLVLVEKVSQFFWKPSHGDVVVASSNIKRDDNNGTKDLIKRVIALPGESVVITEGKVYINGTEIDEPYVDFPEGNGEFEGIVPENHVFIMGDNRGNSHDSRSDDIGYVPFSNLKGRVYLRIWPFNHIRLF